MRQRIQRILKEEKETGVPFPYLSRDIQSLSVLEKVIAKQREWFSKNPENDPLTVLENQRKDQKLKQAFNKFMATPPDYRDAAISCMEMWLKAFEEKTVQAIIDPDGELILPGEDFYGR